jgi:hypothetical protein
MKPTGKAELERAIRETLETAERHGCSASFRRWAEANQIDLDALDPGRMKPPPAGLMESRA